MAMLATSAQWFDVCDALLTLTICRHHSLTTAGSSPLKGTTVGYGYGHPEEYGWPHPRRVRRRRASHDLLEEQFSESVEMSPSPTGDMVGLEVADTEKILAYYECALKHFQQINCRQIAKAFIKFIEPRKQVKHPYNGGKPPAGAPPGQKGDPEKTKPEWWPVDVQHKEPDHLKKEGEFFQFLLSFLPQVLTISRTTATPHSHHAQTPPMGNYLRQAQGSRSGLKAITQRPREVGRDGGDAQGAEAGGTLRAR